MENSLSKEQVQELHVRHAKLTAEIRIGLSRIEVINETIKTGQVPAGVEFKDIGTPLKER